MDADLELGEISKADLPRAADIAALAYVDSAPYVYAGGARMDAATRERMLKFLFLKNFEMGHRYGCFRCAYEMSAETGSPEPLCFLMLVPPSGGIRNAGACDLLRSGLLTSILRFGLAHAVALARVTAWCQQVEEEILQGRAVYRLEGMTVLPARQGRGVGSRALRRALRETDRAGFGVFLATQDARNVTFYGRLGFELLREAVFEPAGFTTWFMLRPPAECPEP